MFANRLSKISYKFHKAIKIDIINIKRFTLYINNE